VPGGFDRDFDFGADAVGGGNQDGVGKTGSLEIEQPAEAADFGAGPGARRCAHQRLDQFHHAVAGIDIDTGGRVAFLIHEITNLDRRISPSGTLSPAPPTSESPGVQARGRRYIVIIQGRRAGAGLSIPNLITLGRILLVPVVVWAITSGEMRIAFLLFLAAGISDAIDGFLAKRFHMASELGAYLDPLADKALIVSIYISLGIAGTLPIFLVILVVSRDIMIISAFMLSWLVGRPMPVRPLLVSKANTVAQILLATLVLAEQAFNFDAALAAQLIMGLVAILTLLSIAFYLAEWVRHMNSFGAGH
jgi:cardiolipin synthase (CMP-forming)